MFFVASLVLTAPVTFAQAQDSTAARAASDSLAAPDSARSDSGSVAAPVAPADNTASAAADSLAPPPDSARTMVDSLDRPVLELAPPEDNLRAAEIDSVQEERLAREGRPERIEARVIPWNWDQYTNVIEIGLRNVKDGIEYSLSRNAVYDTLFTKYQGQLVRVRGRASMDTEGFFNMTVIGILPPDTTKPKSGTVKQP